MKLPEAFGAKASHSLRCIAAPLAHACFSSAKEQSISIPTYGKPGSQTSFSTGRRKEGRGFHGTSGKNKVPLRSRTRFSGRPCFATGAALKNYSEVGPDAG